MSPLTRRPGWWLPLVLVLLVAVPIVEIWILFQVGSLIGFWPTLLILILEAALGGWLMRREGNRAWTALNTAFASGKMPTGELADAALVLVGGVLLMLPGFVTDLFGFFFLLPFTRPYARKALSYFVARRIERAGGTAYVNGTFVGADGVVIEGETVDPERGRPNDPTVIRSEIDER